MVRGASESSNARLAYTRAASRLVRFVVDSGRSILEVGCGVGDRLAALSPEGGVGLDVDAALVEKARLRHPRLTFHQCDLERLDVPALSDRRFDFIVLLDVVGDLSDVWTTLRALRRFCHDETRVVLTCPNALWSPLLPHADEASWIDGAALKNLLTLCHFEVVRESAAQLLPVELPLLSSWVNRYLAAAPGLSRLLLCQLLVCRPRALPPVTAHSCSVIVPCKNERGNIDAILARTPRLGRDTEIIFVDGNSSDGTADAITAHIDGGRHDVRLLHQGEGRGKGDAVRRGFAAARGDLLFILDADLTVAPEDLSKFYTVLAEGSADFVNGTRLSYPMERAAMRPLNRVGNHLFGVALSAVVEQRLSDTLCGTKALFRRDYERIAAGRAFFGRLDPFGDFDLLLGAAKQNLKIVEMPIRYRARTYGDTKIDRFRNGAELLRMTASAFSRWRSAYG